MTTELDVDRCEALAAVIHGGDENAWRELAELLWPHWTQMVRSSRHMGPLARSDDHVHNVVANLIDKLGTDGGRAIHGFPKWKAENPDKTFADWNRIVTSFTIKDYVRHTLGRGSQSSEKEGVPSIKRLLNEFATAPATEDAFGSTRPPMTVAQTARQLLDFAEQSLPKDQLQALSLWIDGASFEEIDAAVGRAGSDEGRKLVRSAVATLRRRFAVASERG